jgi:arylsulfatase A-like enzyme
MGVISKLSSRRAVLAAVIVFAAILLVGGCTRQSTNETAPFESEYDQVDKGAGAQAVSDSARFFDGTKSVKVSYDGSACPVGGCETDRGSTRMMYVYGTPGQPGTGFGDGYEGYLGGAFFLPRAFPTQQKGYIELFRWDNARQYGAGADKGGIAVSPSTHEGQLFRADLNAVEGDSGFHRIGAKFPIPFGRWADIYVHQKLRGASSQTAEAISEVFVNGKRVLTAPGEANSGGRGFDRLVWGLPQMDTTQMGNVTQPGTVVSYWFDRAYASQEAAPPPAPDPNIVVIVTDDQRWGQETSATLMPNLHKWFREGDASTTGGMEIANTYAATPECCPSRASILTGLYAHNHGIRQQDVTDADSQLALAQLANLTLPNYLQQRGYQTGIFGKYLNGWNITQDPPKFDKFSIFGDPYGPEYCPFWTRDSGVVPTVSEHGHDALHNNPGSGDAYCDGDSDSYSTTYFGNRAKDFIDQAETNDSRPWFMYLTPYAPHPQPFPELKYNGDLPGGMTPERTAAYQEADVTDKPPYVGYKTCCSFAGMQPDEAKRDKFRSDQMRTLRSVDDVLDQVFTTVRADGEENNTLAIFVSDNGFIWGEHWLEGKLTPYTYSVRIPMYMRWPGHVAASTNEPRLASTVDIAPTVMDALEPAITPSRAVDGRSLMDTSWLRQYLLLEYKKDPDIGAAANLPSWNALRGTNWQYTRTDDPANPGNYFKEYYTDLPNMMNNLYGSNGAVDPGEPAPKDAELGNAIGCAGTTGSTACP